MVRKGNLAVFESSKISETERAPPTKIGVHACDINPYLHLFFELIPAAFESSNISEIGKATPTKIGVHAWYINSYLHKFFELIPID